MADDYLNGNVKDILEPMISALLIAQPEDPKFFMLHWLKNLYSLDYIIINKEKEELENLRLEVKGYKSKKHEINKAKAEQPLEELKDIIEAPKENENKIENNNENNKENSNENKNEIEIDNKNESDNKIENDKKDETDNKNDTDKKNEVDNKDKSAISIENNNEKKDLEFSSEDSEK